MSSAIPYDPDDFDNNPFAENSIISPITGQQSILNNADSVTSNYDNDNDNDDDDNDNGNDNADDRDIARESHYSADTGYNTNNISSNITSANSQLTNTTNTTTTTDSEFSEYPTDTDLKKYLPERIHKEKHQIIIKIQEIESNGQNTSKNPIFKFNVKVINLSGFRKEIYKNVRRTFKEMESLYKYLIYNNIEVFVPALPLVSNLYTTMSTEFINSTISTFQDWFNRVCNNPILIKNKEFVLFFESNDFSYSPSKTKPSNNSVIATGLKRKTLKQFQPPYDNCEYLSKYRPMIKEVHLNSSKLLEKLDKFLKYNRQSAYYNNEFINLISGLGESETSNEMIKLWQKFHKFTVMLNEADLIKNINFISEIVGYFKQVSDDTYNIKESLTNRHLLMRELLNAEEVTKKKHNTITKLKMKSTIDPIKVDEAIRSLELSNNYEKELRYQVKRTTYEMLIESKEYLNYLVSRGKRLFKVIAKQQILQERKKLNLLLNNRLISQQDSLSRLGREHITENQASKKANGNSNSDSWNSRVKKSYSPERDDEDDEVNHSLGQSGNNTSKNGIVEELTNVNAKSAAFLLGSSSF